MILRFAANSEKCRKYMFLGGSAPFITILHGGGSFRFITILQWGGWGGGSPGTPNLYYVIYGRPLIGKLKQQRNVRRRALLNNRDGQNLGGQGLPIIWLPHQKFCPRFDGSFSWQDHEMEFTSHFFLGLRKNDETLTLGKGSNCRNILNQ